MATISARVAANVRAEAARRRVRQADMAQALGRSQAAVSARLTGRTPFSLSDIERIADLLDVDVADLLAPQLPEDGAA